MTPTTLAAALLRDVPRNVALGVSMPMLPEHLVLAALAAAMDLALSERVQALTTVGYGYDLTDDDKAAITALLAQNAALRAENERRRENSRETFDAMCAMRNSINEHVPMPSLESDLLQGPENSVFCATVAEAVISHVAALRAERDELSSKLEVERFVTDAMHRLAKAAEAQIAALTARVEGLTGAIAAEALRYADFYEVGSDPRNTFVMFAEWVETRAALSATTEEGHE